MLEIYQVYFYIKGTVDVIYRVSDSQQYPAKQEIFMFFTSIIDNFHLWFGFSLNI